ncbi:MAG: hypothetical protein EI684_20645 [Candidatus Viridilinea halotolerans]|uniref:Cobalamin biosynthesis protein CbiG n=1 Tax=Candidatus Viridilinea halotolerans TaxID=2491704 RepID=A0A426TRW6_9CHLR|nr:MAG: hypothetical protein EI684_20645 [Candidatus Viridilinea halotolerans]
MLVGPALQPDADAAPSRLYAATFAHGCRGADGEARAGRPLSHNAGEGAGGEGHPSHPTTDSPSPTTWERGPGGEGHPSHPTTDSPRELGGEGHPSHPTTDSPRWLGGEGHPSPPTNLPVAPHILAVTRNGAALAVRLARELDATAWVPERFATETGASQSYTGPVAEAIVQAWATGQPLILIMATGIAVRAIAPLLDHKANDPAVICLDEAGRSVIPLLGGHQAGANALAQRLAALTGGHAAITTASDTQGIPALDLLGQELGWRPDPTSAVTHVMGCLVNGLPIACFIDPTVASLRPLIEQWFAGCHHLSVVTTPTALRDERYAAALIFSPHHLADLWPTIQSKSIRYHMPLLVAGIGCQRGVPADELAQALHTTLRDAGLDHHCLATLASAEAKADEPGLLELAERLGLPLEIVSSAQLNALDPSHFSPSAASSHLNLPAGVAEPCALLVANGPILVNKRAWGNCTVAVALKRTEEQRNRGTEEQRSRGSVSLEEPIGTQNTALPFPLSHNVGEGAGGEGHPSHPKSVT